MKRTPLKRGTKQMKRTPLRSKTPLRGSKLKSKARKPKKPSIRLTKDKLWKEVKRITRERFEPNCYTCGTHVEGKNDHAGHGKPMGALPLRFKYDIRNIRRQCMVCNIHRGGMQDIFIAKLEQEDEGIAFLLEACYLDEESNAWRIRQDTPSLGGKEATIFVENLLKQYKATMINLPDND